MILLLIHTLFICFVGSVLLWVINNHERDARMARLLKFLVAAAGAAAIAHPLLPLLGVGL